MANDDHLDPTQLQIYTEITLKTKENKIRKYKIKARHIFQFVIYNFGHFKLYKKCTRNDKMYLANVS